MRTLKLTLAYDGTEFAGWQVQLKKRTCQGVLEAALLQVTGQPVRVMGSGRTDAGVHALGQVVRLQTECPLEEAVLCRALNAVLPHDMAVLSVENVPGGFHPTLSAKRKRYRYAIHDGPVRDVFRLRYVWHCHTRLDADAMHRALQALRGTHDFTSFETSGSQRKSSVRTIYDIEARRGQGPQSDLITVEVEANGFLYNMVRTIVGSAVEVGRGRQPEEWIVEVLQGVDRRKAGRTAPPQGLFLVCVQY